MYKETEPEALPEPKKKFGKDFDPFAQKRKTTFENAPDAHLILEKMESGPSSFEGQGMAVPPWSGGLG